MSRVGDFRSEMLNGLDLFSGIGGLSLALQPWARTVAYCEIDRYAQAVLLSRMSTGELEVAPIWPDIRTITGEMLPAIDIIFGGFPCQDISVAGNGVGLGGERSGLFYHIARLIKETNPSFVFLENVPAIRTRGLNSVAQTFTELGYDCRWTIVSAAEVGAPHLRKRWFMLAHANGAGIRDKSGRGSGSHGQVESVTRNNGTKESLADAASVGCEAGILPGGDESQEPFAIRNGCEPMAEPMRKGWPAARRERPTEEGRAGACGIFAGPSWWAAEPNVGRVVNGLPFRMERIRGLGNAVVPAQAREAFKRLMGITVKQG